MMTLPRPLPGTNQVMRAFGADLCCAHSSSLMILVYLSTKTVYKTDIYIHKNALASVRTGVYNRRTAKNTKSQNKKHKKQTRKCYGHHRR